MQRALDNELAPEEQGELSQHLDSHADDARLFQHMKQMDKVLQNPPHERAPRHLAATIMARLADMAERMDPRQLSRMSGLALALALGLVALVLMPVLIAIGWAILTAIGSGAGLTGLIQGIVGALGLVMEVFDTLTANLQAFFAANPGLLLLMLGLIPVSLIGLWRMAPRKRATSDGS